MENQIEYNVTLDLEIKNSEIDYYYYVAVIVSGHTKIVEQPLRFVYERVFSNEKPEELESLITKTVDEIKEMIKEKVREVNVIYETVKSIAEKHGYSFKFKVVQI